MHFQNKAVVPVSREKLWDSLMDIKGISECVPGVENVREVDPDNYLGTMKIRVGPIGLKFEGKIKIVERNKDQWRAVMSAEGADKGAGGGVNANIVMSLNELGPQQTELDVTTDANVLGKIGEFGQPVMRKKADGIMNDFAKNIARKATS